MMTAMDPEIAIDIPNELRIVTHRSVWLIRPSTYQRMPLLEMARPAQESLNGALIDGTWHPFDAVWAAADTSGWYLRILPSGRPKGSYGITTGTICHLVGEAIVRDPSP